MAAVPEQARQAYRLLHIGFVVAPVLAGLDKFFNVLVDWERYVAPVVTDVLPVSAHTLMLIVGVIEIAAGVLVALRPRIGGYVVAVWLWAIIVNLLPPGGPGGAARHRRGARPLGRVDLEAAEVAARDLLVALGADPADEDLAGTPRRVAAAYADLLTPVPFIPTSFANDEGYDELVVARAIPFSSLCRHHLLPFVGVAHVGYLPGDRILGLSKLARVVGQFARELQTQERLTAQVAGWLDEQLAPRGTGVVLDAEHLCMTVRGVQAPGVRTVTSALRGRIRDDPRTRAEFLALATTMRG